MTCGNGVLDSGETCDTKIAAGSKGACPTSSVKKTCEVGMLAGSACKRTCIYTNANAGSSCPGGKCHNDACCTGCWNGSACASGSAVTACGVGGATCTSCDDKNGCTDDSCLTTGLCYAKLNKQC